MTSKGQKTISQGYKRSRKAIADVLYGRPLGRASTDQLDISSMLMATVCTAGILHPGGHE